MKRIFILPFFVTIALLMQNVQAIVQADQVEQSYIKVYIKEVNNTLKTDCSLQGLSLPSEDVIRLPKLIHVPFESIAKYLKKYASSQAYVPENAMKLETPYGLFRIWASESGVMYAPDPEDSKQSTDTSWKAKKLLSITRDEHGGKKLYVASLVLKVLKNKFKVALEPIR